MQLNKASKVDFIANLLTIVVAILVIGLFVQRYILASKPVVSSTPAVGKMISVEGLDTSNSSKNVLIVMMKGCRFCEGSMSFYKTMLQQNQNIGVKFVAVFPPGSEDVQSYLRSYGITGIEVKYSDFTTVDVEGTPTIIVTDQNGKVAKSWFGKLSPERETEVLTFLKS